LPPSNKSLPPFKRFFLCSFAPVFFFSSSLEILLPPPLAKPGRQPSSSQWFEFFPMGLFSPVSLSIRRDPPLPAMIAVFFSPHRPFFLCAAAARAMFFLAAFLCLPENSVFSFLTNIPFFFSQIDPSLFFGYHPFFFPFGRGGLFL